jgi:hypothetical protein
MTAGPAREEEDAMSDATTTPVAAARCGACGAAPKEPEATQATQATEAASEPLTHCEWCGAEYPVPSEG